MKEEIKRQLNSILSTTQALSVILQNLASDSSSEETVNTSASNALYLLDTFPRAYATGIELASVMEFHLTDEQKLLCEQIINVFETGTVTGKYDAISIYPDGPDQVRQITYGRSQTTEYGNLVRLVRMYVDASGSFAEALRPYLDKIGKRTSPLVDDAPFKSLLKRAGAEDPVMRSTQDSFFEAAYFMPTLNWARENGFRRPLSILVLYDSFIHSGGILPFLRSRFPERPPASGGNEERWIKQYIDVRHAWLTTHSNPSVRPSAYRTRDLQREVAAGNWELAARPIMANGTPVGSPHMAAVVVSQPSAIVFRSVDAIGAAELQTDAIEWNELEPLNAAPAVGSAALATQILANANIKLATTHPSGNVDQANARQNVSDAAAGLAAKRSSYGNAPGGSVMLDANLLAGMLALAKTYQFHVTEIAGGSHSPNSRHYVGVAFDVNFINGVHVGANHPQQAAFRAQAAALGATEVLGPGNPGHTTHIHIAWPRP